MKNERTGSRLTRRGFLEAAALAGTAGLAAQVLPGCGTAGESPAQDSGGDGDVAAEALDAARDQAPDDVAPDATAAETWDEVVDVVVAGGGGAGLVAAVAAAEAGASVLLLEKRADVGGATGMSGGIVQAAGTDCQRAAGVLDDTPQKHGDYWLQAGEGWVEEALVRTLAENAPLGVAWLADRGMTYAHVYAIDDLPMVDRALTPARLHIPTGAGENWKQNEGGGLYVQRLQALAADLGVTVRTESPVTGLVRAPDGGVAGVVATAGEQPRRIRARRGVVLATGGYARSVDMARQAAPRLLWEQAAGLNMTPKTATGDGLRLAQKLGAATAGLGGTISYPLTNVGRMEPEGVVPGIWVNRYGQRFVNEAAHYGYVMREVYRQEGHGAWAIFDQHAVDAGTSSSDRASDTLEELAVALEIPPEALVRTVAAWNADVATGEDRTFRKRGGLLPIDTAPFRASALRFVTVGTLGGVRIDPRARVLDVEGQVIPRLYAAGMAAGGFVGEFYPGSGTSITSTLVFGRIAGDGVAAETPVD